MSSNSQPPVTPALGDSTPSPGFCMYHTPTGAYGHINENKSSLNRKMPIQYLEFVKLFLFKHMGGVHVCTHVHRWVGAYLEACEVGTGSLP